MKGNSNTAEPQRHRRGQPAADGPPLHCPEDDFETLFSMVKIQDRRFRPTMERISAAIEVAGPADIAQRFATELGVTRSHASKLLTALRNLVDQPEPGKVAKK